MKKLTEREKLLLTVLFAGILVVLTTIYWVLPTKDSVVMLNQEKQDLELQKLDMETKIAQTNRLVENKEKLISEVDDLMRLMSDSLLGENFDLQAQALASNNNVSIQSLKYGDVQTISPSAVGTPTQKYEYNLKSLVDVYTGQTEEALEPVETEHEVLKKTVVMNVTGSYLSIQKLLSDLNNMGQTYYVKSLSYGRSENTITKEDSNFIETEVNESATIEVDVYFLIPDRSALDSYLPEKG